ncbi:hypothetical protein [Streptomyces sp. NPDC016845]|uniref:hypothetical protein n=1 Tax=Streptomyces sp. NPDC016845 TaxID=3364972 RepID=UPI003799D46E
MDVAVVAFDGDRLNGGIAPALPGPQTGWPLWHGRGTAEPSVQANQQPFGRCVRSAPPSGSTAYTR